MTGVAAAVVAANRQGRITYMNEAAETLTA